LSYHFIGIGGCGMSGLAQVLHHRRHKITGSDKESSTVIERLGRRGIHVNIGHRSDGVPADTEYVVISAAIQDDNPELITARQRGLSIYKYSELLGKLSRQMTTLAIAGTHGKSTTSGWLAYMLRQGGMDPSFVIGADVEQLGGGSGAGRGDYLVVEACEYDRSFLNLHPRVAAILNIEADHMDYYRDLDEIIEAFGDFAQMAGPEGLLVANAADKNLKRILDQKKNRIETFSLHGDDADWRAGQLEFMEGCGHFDLIYGQRGLGRVKLSLPGLHNVANALAVAAMAHEAGLNDQSICLGLENFVGVGRRLSYKGEVGGVVVLDDYAHHPTEIRTTLEAIHGLYHPIRLWCVFQPHQHSRTRFLLSEFASSFGGADVVLLPDIYFVRESEQLRREVNADQLAQQINANKGHAEYLGEFNRILDRLCTETQAGDVVVVMGAGDIWKLADELIYRLGRDCQA